MVPLSRIITLKNTLANFYKKKRLPPPLNNAPCLSPAHYPTPRRAHRQFRPGSPSDFSARQVQGRVW
ncbi:hypothetical protein CEP52_001902 [Fusarium oligoseptatum]|uniref:Uncharacterized protein n=1 Tax=Fusarium oligoseptatum TaxID=2604345 RepID=A0A428UG81_9HYPO|nr:hypothetical protein CEP52_001902 [Fusarium oligoseptatum]